MLSCDVVHRCPNLKPPQFPLESAHYVHASEHLPPAPNKSISNPLTLPLDNSELSVSGEGAR